MFGDLFSYKHKGTLAVNNSASIPALCYCPHMCGRKIYYHACIVYMYTNKKVMFDLCYFLTNSISNNLDERTK